MPYLLWCGSKKAIGNVPDGARQGGGKVCQNCQYENCSRDWLGERFRVVPGLSIEQAIGDVVGGEEMLVGIMPEGTSLIFPEGFGDTREVKARFVLEQLLPLLGVNMALVEVADLLAGKHKLVSVEHATRFIRPGQPGYNTPSEGAGRYERTNRPYTTRPGYTRGDWSALDLIDTMRWGPIGDLPSELPLLMALGADRPGSISDMYTSGLIGARRPATSGPLSGATDLAKSLAVLGYSGAEVDGSLETKSEREGDGTKTTTTFSLKISLTKEDKENKPLDKMGGNGDGQPESDKEGKS